MPHHSITRHALIFTRDHSRRIIDMSTHDPAAVPIACTTGLAWMKSASATTLTFVKVVLPDWLAKMDTAAKATYSLQFGRWLMGRHRRHLIRHSNLRVNVMF